MSAESLDLQRSAELSGRFAWIEDRLFEVTGGWVVSTPEHPVKLHMANVSRHHAWRASLWRERLPHLREMDVDALVAPGDDHLDRLFGVMAEMTDPDSTLERLVGLYRVVVPRLVAAYRHHRDLCTPVADGPVMRVLDLVLRDQMDDWLDAQGLLASLVTSDAMVERAGAYQVLMEKMALAIETPS